MAARFVVYMMVTQSFKDGLLNTKVLGQALINLSSGNSAAKESIVNEGGVRSLLPHLSRLQMPPGLA